MYIVKTKSFLIGKVLEKENGGWHDISCRPFVYMQAFQFQYSIMELNFTLLLCPYFYVYFISSAEWPKFREHSTHSLPGVVSPWLQSQILAQSTPATSTITYLRIISELSTSFIIFIFITFFTMMVRILRDELVISRFVREMFLLIRLTISQDFVVDGSMQCAIETFSLVFKFLNEE